jgi:hypothetical protein
MDTLTASETCVLLSRLVNITLSSFATSLYTQAPAIRQKIYGITETPLREKKLWQLQNNGAVTHFEA